MHAGINDYYAEIVRVKYSVQVQGGVVTNKSVNSNAGSRFLNH